jgi:hypothetical protein
MFRVRCYVANCNVVVAPVLTVTVTCDMIWSRIVRLTVIPERKLLFEVREIRVTVRLLSLASLSSYIGWSPRHSFA